jgi:hypothetical protein
LNAGWAILGASAYLVATAVLLLYVGLAIRRLLELSRTTSALDTLFPPVPAPQAKPATVLLPGLDRYWYLWHLTGLLVVTALFLHPLLLAWTTGEAGRPSLVIGGLLPWSDASGWLHGLYYVLNEGELTDWTVRRPLHLMYLSALTLVTDLELHALLLIRTLVLAAACALLVRQMHLTFGAAAAVVVLAMLLGFAAIFTPTTMSEASGLTFGAASLALIWRGMRHTQVGCYALGAGLMALGLSVRTGPVFVLAAIVAWPLLWSDAPSRQRLRWAFAAALAIAAGTGLAWLWAWVLYSGDNMPGANFAFTLYGLSHGGLPWQAFFEHVDTSGLSQGAQATAAYHAAMAQIQAQPGMFFQGLWSFTLKYLDYRFLYVPHLVSGGVAWLFWIGIGVSLWRWRQREARFLLLAAAGTAATAPIIFWAPDAYRAFIVTAPIDAALVGAAVSTLVSLARGGQRPFSPNDPKTERTHERHLLFGFGALLVACTTILPIVALATGAQRVALEPECAPELNPAVFDLGADSAYLHIVPDATTRSMFGSQIRREDFRNAVDRGGTAFAQELKMLPPGSVLAHGYDLLKPQPVAAWVVFQPGQITGDGIYQVCGIAKQVVSATNGFTLTFARTAARQAAHP